MVAQGSTRTPKGVRFRSIVSRAGVLAGVVGAATSATAQPHPAPPQPAATAAPAPETPPTDTSSEPVPATPPPQLGGSGESCTRSADCTAGLKCIAQVCIDPAKGQEGDTCAAATDCNANLRCIDKRCAKPGGAALAPAPSTTTPQPIQPGVLPPGAKSPPTEEQMKRDAEARFGGASIGTVLGYGYVTESDKGGLVYGSLGAYRFTRVFGLSAGVLLGGQDGLGFLGGGVHLGRHFYFDAMLGSVQGVKYVSNTDPSSLSAGSYAGTSGLGAIGELGFHIPLGGMWTLNPAVLAAAPFSGSKGGTLYAVIGPGLYARKANDP